ncbi:GAL4-like Zn(II)2Cys6 (or C6 zinc) binuclear cluster DNA-binding domain [Teratosphaeria destructans]|uniref:GAL4-like Zn(II)2Cys6 (Or C6 zinc) binuclear cluster DNA-binding domain n=1 Tax=Teratosphaeria destructans TaxID=418781 RepID=A0A9W7SK70_9PEZI|nr:GAL4-like Zn(II)2Cys6 (or C6 zinc) binuclear cluster DNA-binding domain [Teratosphaeria destructans]
MPLRSSGCFLCRKRKIRCDETRPGCRRCATHGVPCPGYKSEQRNGIEFRHQTSITVRRAQDSYQSRKTGNSSSSDGDVGGPDVSLLAVSPTPRTSVISSSSSGAGHGARPAACSNMMNGAVAIVGEELLSRALMWPAQPPERVFSPSTNRSQLYASFLDLYLPQKTRARIDTFSFFATIADLPSNQPALRQALDAMSLITIGSSVKDRNLIEQALRSYGQALGSLAHAIARQDPVDNDGLLATVEVLGACALYDEIGQQSKGWGSHVKGSVSLVLERYIVFKPHTDCHLACQQQLLAARGPESVKSGVSILLLSSAKHSALVWALIERKAPVLARPDWRAIACRSPLQDSSVAFYDAALQVPGLLEQYDALLEAPTLSIGDIDKLLSECDRLEAQLRIW